METPYDLYAKRFSQAAKDLIQNQVAGCTTWEELDSALVRVQQLSRLRSVPKLPTAIGS